jgi:flagellar hook assembly protein FlgD
MAAGEHTLGWDGRDPEGRAVPNGLYLVRLQSGGETRTGRLVMAR